MSEPTTTTTTHPCPHCGSPRDLAARVTGDTVLCSDCGGWFTVIWQAGGVALLPVPAYASTPDAVPGRPLQTKKQEKMQEIGRVGGVRFFKKRRGS